MAMPRELRGKGRGAAARTLVAASFCPSAVLLNRTAGVEQVCKTPGRRLGGRPSGHGGCGKTIRGSARQPRLPDGCSLLPPAATNARRASRAAAPRRSSLRLPLSLPGSFASLTMATSDGLLDHAPSAAMPCQASIPRSGADRPDRRPGCCASQPKRAARGSRSPSRRRAATSEVYAPARERRGSSAWRARTGVRSPRLSCGRSSARSSRPRAAFEQRLRIAYLGPEATFTHSRPASSSARPPTTSPPPSVRGRVPRGGREARPASAGREIERGAHTLRAPRSDLPACAEISAGGGHLAAGPRTTRPRRGRTLMRVHHPPPCNSDDPPPAGRWL